MRPSVHFGDMHSHSENSWAGLWGQGWKDNRLVERIFTADISNER